MASSLDTSTVVKNPPAETVAPLSGSPSMSGIAVLGFLVLWFVLALAASWFGWLENIPSPLLFVAGAAIPAAGFFAAYFGSESFRRWVLAQRLRTVTLVQVLRVVGFFFLIAYGKILPSVFALPTGLTDLAAAVTAPLAAFLLVSSEGLPRRGLLWWHIFGVLAEFISGTMGVLTSPTPLGILAGSLTSQPVCGWPLSLTPTFVGPVTLIFHLMAFCIVYARRDDIR
jgi:hypothetical protein